MFRGVYSSAFDAVVERETANDHLFDSTLVKEVAHRGHRDSGLAELWAEARICFYARILAFSDNLVDAREIQLRNEVAAKCPLHAVIRPKRDLLRLCGIWVDCFRVDDRVG